MGVFNNLVIYDQHVPQSSLRSIVSDLATAWSWSEDQILQGFVAAMMKRPAPNCSADGRQRLRTGGRQEARKGLTSCTEIPKSGLMFIA
jgi:hypothetical protein